MTRTLAALALAATLTGCASLPPVVTSKETFAACQVLDATTTYVALSAGKGFVEGNPLMAGLLKHGWLPFLGFKLALIWIVYEANLSPGAQAAANAVACVPGVWNTHLLVRQ